MTYKQIKIVNDAYLNIAAHLQLKQVEWLHGFSRAYVSKLCRQTGISVDRQTRAVKAPAATLKPFFFDEVQQ